MENEIEQSEYGGYATPAAANESNQLEKFKREIVKLIDKHGEQIDQISKLVQV